MNPQQFTPNSPGSLLPITSRSGREAWAFLPHPLPPDLPSSHELAAGASRVTLALGNLNGAGMLLRNPILLIRPFIQREALASSRMEGTHAEYEDLVLNELDANPDDNADLEEVSNYVSTLSSGWSRAPEQPFAVHFLMTLHQQLMDGVRGQDKNPGQLRTHQLVIGASGDDAHSARFVPPPPEHVRPLLENLCVYATQTTGFASPIRLAILHYQFETIHPFEDGNGRLGRLLIPITLGMWGELDLPLLYLSEYLEDNRSEYIDRLLAVSTDGNWEGWIRFLLDGITAQATDSLTRVRALHDLRETYRAKYQSGRSSNLLAVVDHLFERPALSVKTVTSLLGVTPPAAGAMVRRLVDEGVLQEVTGRSWGRKYLAPEIANVLFARTSHARSLDIT